jgi:hypothetical protein
MTDIGCERKYQNCKRKLNNFYVFSENNAVAQVSGKNKQNKKCCSFIQHPYSLEICTKLAQPYFLRSNDNYVPMIVHCKRNLELVQWNVHCIYVYCSGLEFTGINRKNLEKSAGKSENKPTLLLLWRIKRNCSQFLTSQGLWPKRHCSLTVVSWGN